MSGSCVCGQEAEGQYVCATVLVSFPARRLVSGEPSWRLCPLLKQYEMTIPGMSSDSIAEQLFSFLTSKCEMPGKLIVSIDLYVHMRHGLSISQQKFMWGIYYWVLYLSTWFLLPLAVLAVGKGLTNALILILLQPGAYLIQHNIEDVYTYTMSQQKFIWGFITGYYTLQHGFCFL